jgi:steroid 5-alpha-reductase/3-oxo-5-alpha-steroid 4-dehydrogenase 1
MELPALLMMFGCLIFSEVQSSTGYLLMTLYALHYVHRSLVFPFRIRTTGRQMPLLIVGSAVAFNMINASLLGAGLSGQEEFNPVPVLAGLTLFVIGEGLNLWSDRKLILLRRHATGYFIPSGGLYNLVSCPNYLGEILAWIGFALASQNLAGISFAVWTIANLVPRALSHHRWYRQSFTEYPPSRKALIPGVL